MESRLFDWTGMMPDILANIFCRLSLQERLLNIPRVCKLWKLASEDPACWQIIDLTVCSNRKTPVCKAESLVKMLVIRSQGLLTHLTLPFLMNDAFLTFIACRAPLLRVLHMPNSILLTDYLVTWIAPMMRFITDLDVSGCNGLSHVTLEAFGVHCRHITQLRRNRNFFFTANPDDGEAYTIAQHFPQLEHLEMANGLLSFKGLEAILYGCPKLASLDLRGCCQHLEMDEAFIMECKKRLRVFHEPGDDSFLLLDLQGHYDDA